MQHHTLQVAVWAAGYQTITILYTHAVSTLLPLFWLVKEGWYVGIHTLVKVSSHVMQALPPERLSKKLVLDKFNIRLSTS